MDFQITPTFKRRDLVLQCTGAAATNGVFEADIGGCKFKSEFLGSTATITIPFADLEPLPQLPHNLRVVTPAQAFQLPPVPILNKIDIRTTEDFIDRVQALRKRIDDPEAVRFCSRRLLAQPKSEMNLRAAALCAIGYRIVEGLDPADHDLERFWAWTEQFLGDIGNSDDQVRWTTSVTMCAVYVAILQRDAAATIRFLRNTLAYRSYLPELSLLHTNFSRCSTLLALLEMAGGNRAKADVLLSDVAEIFRVGTRSSWIDHPVRGRNQFSEVFSVLKSARVAAEIQRQARGAKGTEGLIRVAMSTPITPISIVTRRLEEEGHWLAVVRAEASAAAGRELESGAPPAKPKPTKVVPPSAVPIDLAALPDVLKAALTPRGDARAGFLTGVATLSAAAVNAVASDDLAFVSRHDSHLQSLMRLDASVRAERTYLWPSLLDLSRTRFRFAYLALAGGDRDGAYALLTATTQWSKMVLSSASVDTDADFEPAQLFVLASSLAYLAAHRYVVPEARHLTDHGIQVDFLRSFDRTFRDDALRARIARTLKFESSVAA